ncbi:MAG TPA: hypothetical protein VFI23_11965 [Rhizomicrobium sp.]|nr:hypothetical protein [Rhizomicrobium sp.]
MKSPPEHLLFEEESSIDSEWLKDFAARAARSADTPEARRAIRNLYLAGFVGEAAGPGQSRIEIGGAGTRDIGVWRKAGAAANAPFVRRPELGEEWFYWSSTETIPPKKARWRVVLVGESVARGFLYDPDFNPAMALEAMLKAQLGERGIDVIDLAKSNQTQRELKSMIGQCLALRPDVIVAFAGNNWRPQLGERDIPFVENLLRTDGVPGMKAYLDVRREEAARHLVRQASSVLGPRNVKLIWVVPEFNLQDWTDPVSCAPLLGGGDNRVWRDLAQSARQALQARDFALAETLATRMMELDGGTTSVSPRILVECHRAKGDAVATRRFLEMCRDAEGWNPGFSYSPRISTALQDILREAAAIPGQAVVDLPRILEEQQGGGLPGRQMFLDYCHLSATATNAAMTAVGSKVLALLTGREVSPQKLAAGAISPPAKIEGKVSFFAAVHNAHFYQGAEVVRYWCARALELWPECERIMTRYIDIQTRRTPFLACKSAFELAEIDRRERLQYLLRGRVQRLDPMLANVIADCLAGARPAFRKWLADLQIAEHSVKSGAKELTDFCYASAIPTPSERGWTSKSFLNNYGSRAVFASAFDECSKFPFVGEAGQPVKLKLCCRVPGLAEPDATLKIEVNGRLVAQVSVQKAWSAHEALVPGDCVLDGVNEIAVTWPPQTESYQDALRQTSDLLLEGQLQYFRYVFGEIHSLVVFDPARPSQH